MALGRAAAIRFAEPVDHSHAAGIEPVAIDDQRVALAFGDGRSHSFIRGQSALDAAGIESHGEALEAGIPELLAGKKHARERFTFVVEDVDARGGFASAHGLGEQDVEAELIARQDIR